MKLTTIKASNFLSYETLEFNLDGQGLVLINGDNQTDTASLANNGAGKTSLLSAIFYALYGELPNGDGADKVVNRINKKKCVVELTFEQSESTFVVTRGRKPAKFEITQDGETITAGTMKASQTLLESIVKIPKNVFLSTIYFDGYNSRPFSTLTDKERKAYLETLFDISVYSRAQEEVKVRQKDNKDKLQQAERQLLQDEQSLEVAKRTQANSITYKQSLDAKVEESLTAYKDAYETLQSLSDALDDKLLAIDTETIVFNEDATLQEVKTAYANAKAEYDKEVAEKTRDLNMRQFSAISLARDAKNDTLKEYEKVNVVKTDIQTHERNREQLLANYKSLGTKQEELKGTLEGLESQIKRLSTSDACPVCEGPIDNEHKQRELQSIVSSKDLVEKAIIQAQEQQQQVMQEGKDVATLLTEVKKQLPIAEKKYQEVQATANEQAEKEHALTDQLRTVERDLQEAYNTKVAELVSRIQQLESDKQTALNSQRDAEAKKARLQAEEKALATEAHYAKERYDEAVSASEGYVIDTGSQDELLTAIETDKQAIVALKEEAEHLKQANFAFSDQGIKSHVLDLVTPQLNEKIHNYLTKLTGGTITVQFSTTTTKADGTLADKFDIAVTNNGQDASYDSLSAGEKRRVDIAISLTLQDIVMQKAELKTNVLTYDELFESLDATGCEHVIELLKERLTQVSSIFVITHNDQLKPLFEKVITVTKKGGFSTLAS